MAKSQQTFSKKEREKKKFRDRKDKEEKREERKTSNNKGKSFEEMLAYVDEYGRLSSTPPDPKTRNVMKLEDIQIGVAKQKEADPADLIRTGIVTFFNESKGYGFIKDMETQESVFVHISALTEPLKENNKVTFEVEMGPKGATAVRVKAAL